MVNTVACEGCRNQASSNSDLDNPQRPPQEGEEEVVTGAKQLPKVHISLVNPAQTIFTKSSDKIKVQITAEQDLSEEDLQSVTIDYEQDPVNGASLRTAKPGAAGHDGVKLSGVNLAGLLGVTKLAKGAHQDLELTFGGNNNKTTIFTHIKLKNSDQEDKPENQIPQIKWDIPIPSLSITSPASFQGKEELEVIITNEGTSSIDAGHIYLYVTSTNKQVTFKVDQETQKDGQGELLTQITGKFYTVIPSQGNLKLDIQVEDAQGCTETTIGVIAKYKNSTGEVIGKLENVKWTAN